MGNKCLRNWSIEPLSDLKESRRQKKVKYFFQACRQFAEKDCPCSKPTFQQA